MKLNQAVLMPISRLQKSLLLLVLLTSCSAQSTYYITATPDTPCPEEPCHTLSQYVADQDLINLPMNITVKFLPGNHTLEQTISAINLTKLALYGDSSSLPEVTSRIVCTWPAGFVFTGIAELHIRSLAFISCGHNESAAVSITSVQLFDVSNCTFRNNMNINCSYENTDFTIYGHGYRGGALNIQNSNVMLTANKFQLNCAEGGGALYMNTSNSTFTGNMFEYNSANVWHGGALYAEASSLNFTRNTFQSNFAEFDGGVLYMYKSSSIITGNTFENNSGGSNGGALYVESSILNFARNIFQSNFAKSHDGGVLYLYSSSSIITGNKFEYNYAGSSGGALYVDSGTLNLTGNTFQYNFGEHGGALYVQFSYFSITRGTLQNNAAEYGGAIYVHSFFKLTWSTFQNNSATKYGGALYVLSSTLNCIERNIIGNNTALYGGGIAVLDGQLDLSGNITFESNTATYGGGLYVYDTKIIGNMILSYNSATEGGGGVYALQSIFNFTGESTIQNNIAWDGGGILLSGESKFYLQSNTHVHFINNGARRTGGAIKVQESNSLPYCIHYNGFTCFFEIASPRRCFKYLECDQYINDLNVNITFDNNSAVEAGADLHGGSLDHCMCFSDIDPVCSGWISSGEVFDVISGSKNTLDISSEPLYICTCKDSLIDCTGSYHHPDPVYPGGMLKVPVIARGQRNGTTAAVIQLINTFSGSITFEKHENIQHADNKCTTLTYTIYSYEESITQEMALYAKGPCLPTDNSSKTNPSNTLRVLIDIPRCPPGFQISKIKPKCVCAERLQKFTNTCLVDDKEILRAQDAEFWVGYDSTSQGLILHPHCPFVYCTVKELYLSVDDSSKQCNYNRSGLLCGTCSDNLSLALGSSRCLKCSNSYLGLLVAFAFAGLALVLLLYVLRLTVAAGTINGLIFYGNVVVVNSATFFQPQTTNIFTVFIAWLNLDLGIETCFYNGMNAYAKTWLQFAFPFYVWALVGMIIIGSHYSSRVAKLFGSNPVAVLATLFLLSYAKLLRTVFAALSYTYLEYPNNSQIAVWLYDGNIRYLNGKHTPLFIAAIICLIFLFFPYTMLLIFSQCLQAKSELKIFSSINSRYVKPFLDAYHAPYSNKHRYWTGVMLLFRFVLFLISAVNVLGDPNVNLLAIASVTTVILPFILGSRIYKTWSLGLLETSFVINLTILAVATLYIRLTRGNQNAATLTSVGMAFASFTGIIVHHSIQQIKSTRLWRKLYLKRNYPLTNVASRHEDPPDRVFVSGSAPTQTVVNVCYHELREPCMATD